MSYISLIDWWVMSCVHQLYNHHAKWRSWEKSFITRFVPLYLPVSAPRLGNTGFGAKSRFALFVTPPACFREVWVFRVSWWIWVRGGFLRLIGWKNFCENLNKFYRLETPFIDWFHSRMKISSSFLIPFLISVGAGIRPKFLVFPNWFIECRTIMFPLSISSQYSIVGASSSAFSSGQYSISANIPVGPKIANIAKYSNPRPICSISCAGTSFVGKRGHLQFQPIRPDGLWPETARLLFFPASQGGGGGKDTLFDHHHQCHHRHHRHRYHAQVKEEKIGKPPTHPFSSSL